MESLVIWYQNSLGSFMPKEVFIFLVSMLPLIELRGGLIIASLLKVPLVQANIICIIGNIIPIPFILLFIKKIFEFMKKHNIMKKSGIQVRGQSSKEIEWRGKGRIYFPVAVCWNPASGYRCMDRFSDRFFIRVRH